MTEQPRPLPDFDLPPVVETVLGVQFAPLQQFSSPYFGLFWKEIRASYPSFELRPPLDVVIEEFGSLRPGPTLGVELVAEPAVRCWFKNGDSTQLIQVQRDRFVQNWRKVTGDELYPRYARLKPSFREEWTRFCRFLEREGIGVPEVNQCEVTYVNHIEIGSVLGSYGEMQRVVSGWSGRNSGNFLPHPESVRLNTTYVMPDKRGRLHIVLQPAIRRRDAKEIVQLNLTARGRPHSSGVEDILDWFDMGHEWIVRGFTDFTTPEMHEVWERKS